MLVAHSKMSNLGDSEKRIIETGEKITTAIIMILGQVPRYERLAALVNKTIINTKEHSLVQAIGVRRFISDIS